MLACGFEMAYQSSKRTKGDDWHLAVDKYLSEMGSVTLEQFEKQNELRADDKEEWLTNSQELDTLLEPKSKQGASGKGNSSSQKKKPSDEEVANKAKEIVKGFRSLIGGVSSFEGADVPG